jgi:hypothetical protein
MKMKMLLHNQSNNCKEVKCIKSNEKSLPKPFVPKLIVWCIGTSSKRAAHLVAAKRKDDENGSRKRSRVTSAGFDFEVVTSDGSTSGIIFKRFSWNPRKPLFDDKEIAKAKLNVMTTTAQVALTATAVKANGAIEQTTNRPGSTNLDLINKSEHTDTSKSKCQTRRLSSSPSEKGKFFWKPNAGAIKLTGISRTVQAARAVASLAEEVNPGSSSIDSSRKYDEDPVVKIKLSEIVCKWKALA